MTHATSVSYIRYMEAKATGTNQEDDIMANDNDFAQKNQAALIAADALPASALQDVLAFISDDECCPGRYLVSGVVIDAVESLDYPGSLDAFSFDGYRVELSAIDAFCRAVTLRVQDPLA